MERASEKKLLFLYEQKKSIWFEAQLKNTETQLKSVIMARYFSESSTMKNIHIYIFFSTYIYLKLTKFSCNPSFSLSHILKGHGNCFSFFAFTLYVMWLCDGGGGGNNNIVCVSLSALSLSLKDNSACFATPFAENCFDQPANK